MWGRNVHVVNRETSNNCSLTKYLLQPCVEGLHLCREVSLVGETLGYWGGTEDLCCKVEVSLE